MQLPLPLPEALRQWIAINAEYHVLVCHITGCQQALSPRAISRHLRDKHQVKSGLYKQADQYIKQWQWQYDFQSVPLPPDKSAPQPILPVFAGFQCQDCDHKSQSRQAIRKHVNKEHDKKRLPDNELFQAVQLQTWFGEKRARYWVVNATRQSDVNNESRDVNNSSSSGSGDASAVIRAEIAEWMAQEEGQYQASTVAAEVDPWLRYTGWEEVLAGSKHDLVTTAAFTATATATEPELERLI